MEDANEVKITLHSFHTVNKMRGSVKFVTFPKELYL